MSFCPETKGEAEKFIETVRREWRKTGKTLPSRSWGPTQITLFMKKGGADLLRDLVANSGVTFDEAKALMERFWEMYRLEILEGVPSDKRFLTEAKAPLVFDRLVSELKANEKTFEENRFDRTSLVSTTLYYGKLSRSDVSFLSSRPSLEGQGIEEDAARDFIDGIRCRHAGKTIYGMRRSPEVVAFMDGEGRRILSDFGSMTSVTFKEASQLLESFEKMCRRQDVSIPSDMGYGPILRQLICEHDENRNAVDAGLVRSGELVSATTYHGAIGHRIVEQIPSLKGSSVLKQALYFRPCDPWLFLKKRGYSPFSSADLFQTEDSQAFIEEVRLDRKAKNIQALRNPLHMEAIMNGVAAEQLTELAQGTTIQDTDIKLLKGRFLAMCRYQGKELFFPPEASLAILTRLVAELKKNMEALEGTSVRPDQLISATLYHGAIGSRLVDSDPSLKGSFLLKKVLVRHSVDLRGVEDIGSDGGTAAFVDRMRFLQKTEGKPVRYDSAAFGSSPDQRAFLEKISKGGFTHFLSDAGLSPGDSKDILILGGVIVANFERMCSGRVHRFPFSARRHELLAQFVSELRENQKALGEISPEKLVSVTLLNGAILPRLVENNPFFSDTRAAFVRALGSCPSDPQRFLTEMQVKAEHLIKESERPENSYFVFRQEPWQFKSAVAKRPSTAEKVLDRKAQSRILPSCAPH